MSTTIKSVPVTALPAIGAELDGGAFFGITTRKDGTHCAAVLLPAKSDKRLPWKPAMAWAAKQSGELPSRPVAALLFANLKDKLTPNWHWTCDTHKDDASYAWYCYFGYGRQDLIRKSYEGAVVAVRLIPLTA